MHITDVSKSGRIRAPPDRRTLGTLTYFKYIFRIRIYDVNTVMHISSSYFDDTCMNLMIHVQEFWKKILIDAWINIFFLEIYTRIYKKEKRFEKSENSFQKHLHTYLFLYNEAVKCVVVNIILMDSYVIIVSFIFNMTQFIPIKSTKI